ncbi:lipid II flippase family protein [Metabacillus sediminilitoris]
MIITMTETLAYSTRISGTRVQLIATVISLSSTLAVIYSNLFWLSCSPFP